MSPEQFEVIAKLLRSRGNAKVAARMVLIDNESNSETAHSLGMTLQGVHNSVQRFRRADDLIREAYSHGSQ